jgi:hypothetical protein
MKPTPIKIPEDLDLKAMADAPLADPLRLNIPFGKRTAPRGERARYYDGIDVPRMTREEINKRKEEAFSKKLCAVLDYYATTEVPIERVAEHTGLTVEQATAAMERRGRKS